jgi:hypothetical protein
MGSGGEREGVGGGGGEMTQAMYAHVNKKFKKKSKGVQRDHSKKFVY